MLFFLSKISLSFDCQAVYTKDGCAVCITHYADRQCGWCNSTQQCISYDDASKCPSGNLWYGPEADCSKPAPVIPTPQPPVPTQAPIPQECEIYQNDGCEMCISHYADRKCGWNSIDNKCETYDKKTCDDAHFYYGDNAKCGGVIPTPTPTPWPVYEANTTFCRLLSDTWCSKCVATQPNMSCVWCHDTNECAMGDKDGFFFGECKSYSYADDDKCKGYYSKGSIIGIRAVVSVIVAALVVAGILVCYKSIKQPKDGYDNVQ